MQRQWPVLCLCVVFATVAACAGTRQPGAESGLHVVRVDRHAMRMQSSGLGSREAGQPVIVFEAGATQSLDTWRNVVPLLIGTAPLFAYDRSGLGESAWDERSPTPQHITGKLRRLLREVGADPPYILVGHSWGGSLMRFFAGYYPDEVAGIVYVDPGPIVTQSVADELAPFEAIGEGRTAYEAFWSGYEQALARASPAIRAEFGVYRQLMQLETSERDLRPQPDVPSLSRLAVHRFRFRLGSWEGLGVVPFFRYGNSVPVDAQSCRDPSFVSGAPGAHSASFRPRRHLWDRRLVPRACGYR